MKTLKHCIKLSSSIKVYVPSTVNVNERIYSQEWIDKTLKFLSQCFGGSTASNALGAWVSSNGELVKEDVTMVFAYTNQSDLESNIDKVYGFCLDMKKDLTQEAIALEVNGELYLI